jgi:hypothetical protein
MTMTHSNQALLWTGILAAATVGGAPAAACVLPFAATAAVAAFTLDIRRAMAAIGLVWLLNQAIGYGLMEYPVTQYSIGWGAALLGASVAALVAARFVRIAIVQRSADRAQDGPAMAAGFVAAFAVYEGSLFALAQFAGGLDTFAPDIVATIGLNDTLWFALLMGLRWVLVNAAPASFGRRALVRAA